MDFISPWIHTTDRCNLKCHYCYVRGNAVMTQAVYDNLRDFLLSAPTERRHLRFAGGEPLLVFDMWEDFAREILTHKGTTVEVLTNFISPPENFWNFTELPNVNVSVSIDNGKTVKVLDKSMVEKLSRLQNPWIMTTITTENVNNLDVLATFIGLNNYGWCLTTDYFEKTMPLWEDLSVAIMRVMDILKECNYDFSKISFNNFSMNSNFSGCRAGDEMVAVAPNGDIYACQTLIGVTAPIGNVRTGYKRKKRATRKGCGCCVISDLCSGWCPIHFNPPSKICNVIKMFAERVIREVGHRNEDLRGMEQFGV